MIDYVNLIINCVLIVFYIASLFLISEIRKRTKEGLNKGLTWMAIAILVLTALRIINILTDFYIINNGYMDYIIYGLMILFALTFAIGIYIILVSIKRVSDGRRR